ncbi:MAG: hypothetical protein FWD57_10305 [Polyangiaceae bacterium]|nr:hypothetical protein [Polyangiaceae bacterium]
MQPSRLMMLPARAEGMMRIGWHRGAANTGKQRWIERLRATAKAISWTESVEEYRESTAVFV